MFSSQKECMYKEKHGSEAINDSIKSPTIREKPVHL